MGGAGASSESLSRMVSAKVGVLGGKLRWGVGPGWAGVGSFAEAARAKWPARPSACPMLESRRMFWAGAGAVPTPGARDVLVGPGVGRPHRVERGGEHAAGAAADGGRDVVAGAGVGCVGNADWCGGWVVAVRKGSGGRQEVKEKGETLRGETGPSLRRG